MLKKHIEDWGSALKRELIGFRNGRSETLANMLGYSEMTPDLMTEIALFNEAMYYADTMSEREIGSAVDRLIIAAKDAGPNGKARAMLLN